MQYSRLGNTGLIVSRLSFGAMTFGTGAGPFATVSKVSELNDLTAPPVQYPGWFHERTVDPQHKEALGDALGR